MKAVWAKRREEFAKQNEAILRRYADDDSIKTATDLLNKLTDAEKEAIEKTPSKFFGSMLERVAVLRTELEKFRAEAEAAKKEFLDTLNESNKIEGLRGAKGDTSPDLSADARKDYEDEQKKYRDLSDELYKATHNDFDNRKFELDKWHGEMVNGVENTARESETIEKIYAAKSAQIEQERADKLKEIRDSIAAADKTVLQNKLDTIDKERQAWIKAGMDEAEATELAEKKKLQARQEAAEKAQEYLKNAADIEYGLTHSTFEKQLRDIEQWKDAQMKKAETAEEVAGIIKNAAAKEAEAFEAAMDRIKGKLQSLDDKIFEIDHSQYENDLRRIRQERLQSLEYFQKEGVLTPELKSQIDYLYNRQKQKLDARAAKGGDYTKPPEGSMQRGGNGIMVIGADQIIDDGKINRSIGLIADDSREFSQLLQGLSKDGRDLAIANRQLADAQKNLIQSTNQTADGFQLIEGDKFINQPAAPQVVEGDQVVADVQQFGDAVQQSTDPVQALKDSAQEAATAQKSLADNVSALPPEYFKNLADGTKAVSEMQLSLTKSTMNLKDKFDALATKLESLSTVNQSRDNNQQQTPDGMMSLAKSTQDVQQAQTLLARTTRDVDSNLRDISDIPPQSQIAQRDRGLKFGIDYDTFKDVLLTGAGLAGGAMTTGVGTAAVPAIAVGTLATAIAAAIGKGTYDATTAEQPANQLNALPAEVDLSEITTPLGKIDTNVQSILQAIQPQEQTSEADRFQEYFGALPNIESYVQDILLEMQSQAEGESPDYLTPLSNISDNVQSILQQMQDTQANENDRLQEYLGALPNIEASVQDILLELQARGEVPEQGATLPQTGAQGSMPDSAATTPQMPEQTAIDYTTLISGIDGKLQSVLDVMPSKESISFETVVRPLDNIAGLVQNILTALENRQPPQITVSPNNNIDLGGAYVFDDAMKRELVDDVTSEIVNHITDAVSQGISKSSYNFSA